MLPQDCALFASSEGGADHVQVFADFVDQTENGESREREWWDGSRKEEARRHVEWGARAHCATCFRTWRPKMDVLRHVHLARAEARYVKCGENVKSTFW